MVESPELQQLKRQLRRKDLWERLRPNLSGASFLAVLLIVLVGVAYSSVQRQRDVEGAALHSASGAVTSRHYEHEQGSEGEPGPLRLVDVQIDGKRFTVGTLVSQLSPEMLSPGLRVGQRVHFSYRVGKSGQCYLESIQPDEAARR